VENAFKHGGNADGFFQVEIRLVLEKNDLDFSLKNNRPERPASHANSGIGLENVQRRLELLYPGRHEMEVQKTKGGFFIRLKIRRS
jgi:LytS/YehU family sensor histidine kinase